MAGLLLVDVDDPHQVEVGATWKTQHHCGRTSCMCVTATAVQATVKQSHVEVPCAVHTTRA